MEVCEIVGSEGLFSEPSSLPFSQPSTTSFLDTQEQADNAREALDAFLIISKLSPVRKTLSVPWGEASDRTRRDYVEELRKVMTAAAQVLAPSSSQELMDAVMAPATTEPSESDKALETFAAAYKNQDRWDIRRQILSIMTDKYTFNEMKRFIPDLTQYRFKAARKHALQFGRGVAPTVEKVTRQRIDDTQVLHFINFLTDNHLQDLPLTEKTLTLSSGEEVPVPQVVLTSIPSTIIHQYIAYCTEVSFNSPSEMTLRRVLHACGTKYRYLT